MHRFQGHLFDLTNITSGTSNFDLTPGFNSIPNPFRPNLLHSIRVVPLPRKGSKTHSPLYVKI
jgi:hypothetical protein